ncbi:MAG: YiiX/YebB-like N1pC/P60 family cysteine hydrolase [Pseudomonadota bacterium]
MEGARRKTLTLLALALLSSPAHPAPELGPALQPGDIVFRRQSGFFSEIARRHSVGEKRFSHAGIYAVRDGQPVVVHAIYDSERARDGVVIDSFDDFLRDASDWAAYRTRMSDAQRAKIGQLALVAADAAVPFDLDFDLASTSTVYCTEFIWRTVNTVAAYELMPSSRLAGKRDVVRLSDLILGDGTFVIADATVVNNATPIGKKP